MELNNIPEHSRKQVYVINGYPGSGKTTFGSLTGKVLSQFHVHFVHTSSIDPIKHILKPKSTWDATVIDPTLWSLLEECKAEVTDLDWDGETKDVYWRGVMSALKQKLTDLVPSLVQNYIYLQVQSILSPGVVFVDIREPENIDALKQYFQKEDNSIPVQAIFIESDTVAAYDNPSDARVEQYIYDYSIDNRRSGGGKDKETLRLQVENFCKQHILRTID